MNTTLVTQPKGFALRVQPQGCWRTFKYFLLIESYNLNHRKHHRFFRYYGKREACVKEPVLPRAKPTSSRQGPDISRQGSPPALASPEASSLPIPLMGLAPWPPFASPHGPTLTMAPRPRRPLRCRCGPVRLQPDDVELPGPQLSREPRRQPEVLARRKRPRGMPGYVVHACALGFFCRHAGSCSFGA